MEIWNSINQKQRRTDAVKPERRHNREYFGSNRNCLRGIPRDNSNWREIIRILCFEYNHRHATKTKCCSRATSDQRRSFFYEFFACVHKKFGCDPRNLKSRHILYYLRLKIQQGIANGSDDHAIIRLVENKIAYLRFFEKMIGKCGLVQKAQYYIDKLAPQLTRVKAPAFRARHLRDEDLEDLISKAFELDIRLGLQVMAMAYFGLRPKESIGLVCSKCFIRQSNRLILRIHPRSGSKGGRPRDIEFNNDSQLQAATILLEVARDTGIDSLSWEGLTMEQAVKKQNRFLNQKLGLGRSTFNGTVYSLRHSFAQRLKEEVNQTDGSNSDERVSNALGHYRKEITGVYVGAVQKAGADLIKPLLSQLSRLPARSYEASQVLITVLRELFYEDPRLAISLTFRFWDKQNVQDALGLAVRKAAFCSGKGLMAFNEVLEAVSALNITSEEMIAALSSHQSTLTLDFLEKNVLTVADAIYATN